MNEFKEVLTVIGASLGAIAFFQNFIKPISDVNKTKWNNLKNEISDINFENIALSLWQQHRIDSISLTRLQNLIFNIERNSEELCFKTVFRNKFSAHFKKIHEQYIQWRTLIRVPYWKPGGASLEESAWTLDQEAFYRVWEETGKEDDRVRADKDYVEHLTRAYDLVEDMRREYRKISVLANREAYEFLLPWKWF